MRTRLLDAMAASLEGRIKYHQANIEVYLEHPVGIGEHPDIMEAIESELGKLAEAEEKLQTLQGFY